MAIRSCNLNRPNWLMLLSFVFVLCAPEIAKGQQSNRFKPVTTKRQTHVTTTETSRTTTRSTEAKLFPGHRKSVIFPDEEETEVTDGGFDKTPQSIPLDLLNQLNDATDWEQFLAFVDNVTILKDHSEGVRVQALWHDVDGRSSALMAEERDGSIQAKPASCIPELQTVSLIKSSDSTLVYYPSCTRVERCGGCCTSELLVCEPTKTETILYQVLKTQYTGGSRMKYAGKEVIPVEKHTACKCQCKVKASHCTVNQIYVPSACRCECSNTDDRRKCEAENRTRFWDPQNCRCRCRVDDIKQECSTDFYYNEASCRCEPWILKRRDVDFHEESDHNLAELQPASSNNVVVGRRPQIRPIYKEEDAYEEEEKKARPVEHFKFVNSWAYQNNRQTGQRN